LGADPGVNVDHAAGGVYRAESVPAVSDCLHTIVDIATRRRANLTTLTRIFTRMTGNENAQSSSANLPSSAKENLEVLSQFKDREEEEISGLQLAIERVSRFFGSPAFFAFALAFIVMWIAVNTWGRTHGWRHFDSPPFFWLQGLVSCNALLLTVAVLIRQNRMARVAEHRARRVCARPRAGSAEGRCRPADRGRAAGIRPRAGERRAGRAAADHLLADGAPAGRA